MIKRLVRSALKRVGYDLVQTRFQTPDFEPEFLPLMEKCRPFTMTSPERMYALYKATEYVVRSGIPGDVVECGVWRGGSSMLAALSLKALGDTSRTLYLYDTYTGMSEPTEKDVKWSGQAAQDSWPDLQQGDHNAWCYAPEAEVRKNMAATGYPQERLVFVKGKVEETIPGTVPPSIAILRLDTDWYESTLHELEHLYPLLSPGGVLLLDDYGSWQGARQATDEFLDRHKIRAFLHRIDYSGRLLVKPG